MTLLASTSPPTLRPTPTVTQCDMHDGGAPRERLMMVSRCASYRLSCSCSCCQSLQTCIHACICRRGRQNEHKLGPAALLALYSCIADKQPVLGWVGQPCNHVHTDDWVCCAARTGDSACVCGSASCMQGYVLMHGGQGQWV